MEFEFGNAPFRYSVLKLIELIKNQPVIWDSTRPDLRTISQKDKAWEEVCAGLDDNYRLLDEKTQHEIAMLATNKWKNIRDAFVRSCKKQVRDSRMRKYMYHDQLSFMLKLFDTNTRKCARQRLGSNTSATNSFTENSLDEDSSDPLRTCFKLELCDQLMDSYETTMEEKYPEEVVVCDPSSHRIDENKIGKRRHSVLDDDNEDKRHRKAQRTKRPYNDEEEGGQTCSATIRKEDKKVSEPLNFTVDEDESFFNSTLSLVRDMTIDEKLEFRMEVLRVIHEIRLKRQEK